MVATGAEGSARFVRRGTLGQGGFGVVHRAFDRVRGIEVAQKSLPSLEASALFRLKREFRALQGLRHRNLVSLYDLVEQGGDWFFTMELVEGVDAMTFIGAPRSVSADAPTEVAPASGVVSVSPPGVPRSRRLSAVDGARLRATLVQVVEALDALHAAGKLHRDVKPSNVLVEPSGRVVVLDFGLVADLRGVDRGLTSRGVVAGTPAYMAPEQACGGELSPATDLYAVGVMLFEALTGALPHEGAPLEMLTRKQLFEAPRASSIAAGVDPQLDELCSQMLRRDPRERPTAVEVLTTLGGAARPRGPTSGEGLFVGRSAELEALRAALARPSTVGGVVCIEGPSGIGKSALVARLVDDAGRAGALVLAGRCFERESVPYKALDAVVDQLARLLLSHDGAQGLLARDVGLLARLFPVLRGVPSVARAAAAIEAPPDPHELRRRAFSALIELIDVAAMGRPVVVSVDDVQWADVDSVALLRALSGSLDRLLLVLSYRGRDRGDSAALAALLDGPLSLPPERATITLRGLDDASTGALLAALVGDGAVAARAAREANGSPFLLRELSRHIATSGADGGDGASLRHALARRIGALPADAAALLAVVAVAAGPLDARVARAVARLDAGAAHEAIEVLRGEQMVRAVPGGGERVEPYHDRIREHAARALGEGDRRRLHRALLEALELEREPPEVLLFHARGAGDDASVARLALCCAETAERALAFERAAELYDHVLSCTHMHVDRAVARRRADALAHAGRGPEAAAAYAALRDGAAADEARELRWRAANALLRSGHHDDGLLALRSLTADEGLPLDDGPFGLIVRIALLRVYLLAREALGLRPGRSPEAASRADLCWTAAVGLAGDPLPSALSQARNLAASLDSGDPHRIARARAMEVLMLSSQGAARARVDAALSAARRAATAARSPHADALVTVMDGMASYLRGDFRQGLSALDRGERLLSERCVGVAWELDVARVFALECLAYLGDLAELSRRVPRLIDEAERKGDRLAATMLRTGIQNLAFVATDDVAAARANVEAAERAWTPRGFHVQHFLHLFARVQLALYEGDPRSALERLSAAEGPLRRSMLGRMPFVRICALYLRARAAVCASAGATGREARALRDQARGDARRLARLGAGWARAYAACIEAALTALSGDRGAAALGFEQAAEAFDGLEMALFAAAARLASSDCRGDSAGAIEATIRALGAAAPRKMAAMLVPCPLAGAT